MLLTSMKDTTDEQMDDGLSVASDDTDLDDDCPTFRNLRHLLKVNFLHILLANIFNKYNL